MRTINQFKNLDEMRELLIKVDGNVPVRLKDIATVTQGYKEREGIVRIDGHEAIELAIYKEGDANTVSVAKAVNAQVEKLKDSLPKGAKLSTIEDQSIFIEHALSEVKFDALLGGVLAILIIFFFLGHAWSTFIISLSLPVSLIATFFFMGQLHLSLNVMSLGGLALATGMVVDDSIVVLENIARLREKGASIVEAAVRGTRRSRHGRDRVDADDGRGVLPAGVRAGRRRPAVPRPGADRHVRDADLAGRRDDADPDARLAARPRAARVSRRSPSRRRAR